MYNRDGRKAVPKAALLEFFSLLNPEKKPRGVNEVLVEMVVKLNLPFTVSETKIFKEFVKVCRGDPADLILSGTIASRIRAKHETILSDIKIKLDESCESIALTLDIWTSPDGYGILAINGTWLDENFKFNRELLYFNKIEDHSGDNLASIVYSMLADFNLRKKLISISADNVTNNNTLCTHLENLLFTWASNANANLKFSSTNRVRCMAHVLNSICQDMIKVMNNGGPNPIESTQPTQSITENYQNTSTQHFPKERGDVQVIRDLIIWINQSPERQTHWSSMSSKCLDCDVVTRWNSTHKMLSKALELRNELCGFVEKHRELASYKLDNDLWNRIRSIKNVLNIFEAVIEDVSNEESSLHLGLGYYNCLEKRLSSIIQREPIGTILRQAALRGQEVLDRYVQLAKETDIYYIASILNPARKMRDILHYKNEGCMVVERIRQVLMSKYPELPSSVETQTPIDRIEIFDNYSGNLLGDLGESVTQRDNLNLNNDIERYFKNHSANMDGFQGTEKGIRNWWNTNKELYPRMAQVARDYLCIPISEVDIERLFSSGRDVIGIRRHSLSSDTLNALMMLKGRLKGDEFDE